MEKQIIGEIGDKTIRKKIKEWFNSKIKSNLKPYLFYLNGLKSLFSNGLASILLQFDCDSEKPLRYNRVLKWPKVSFAPSSDMKDNYKKLIDFSKLYDMIPDGGIVPKFAKDKLASVLNWGARKAVGFVVDNCLNGVACIVNLLLEIFYGNMNHEQCMKCYEENEKMFKYEKISGEERDLNLKCYDFQKDMFTLSFQGVYQVVNVDLNKEESKILPNTTLQYMLILFNRVELVLKEQSIPLSDPKLENRLIDLCSLYDIRSIGNGVDNSGLFTIRTLVEGLEIEKLKWFMYFHVFEDEHSKIKNYLDRQSVGGGVNITIYDFKLKLVQILDEKVVHFIGRSKIL